MDKVGYKATTGIMLTMAQNNLKAETKKYYQIKCQASTHRESFLESLAQAQAIAKKWIKSDILRHSDSESNKGKRFDTSKQLLKTYNTEA